MDWKAFRLFESAELLQTVDLNRVLEEVYHYRLKRREGKSHIFVKQDPQRKISTAMGSNGLPMWLDLHDERFHGVVVDFIRHEEQCSERAAWDRMRDICQKLYASQWTYIVSVRKNFGQTTGIRRPAPQVRISAAAGFDLEAYRQRPIEHPKQTFTFEPAVNFDFLLGRSITRETLEHPLFKGRFGNARGKLGSDGELKITANRSSPYRFEYHVIVPYWRGAEIVALEAKNRYTDEGYQEAIERAVAAGDSPRDVRPNPSLFYKGSIKDGAWTSNIPSDPTAVFVTEQPANALAHFQVHPDDPDIERTIFIATGGTLTAAHLALLHELIVTYGIERVQLGFDGDPAGLEYAFTVIQNLPFNRTAGFAAQKYDLKLRVNPDKKMELSFYSLTELTSTTPTDMLAKVQAIRTALEKDYPFEGSVDQVPALTVSDRLCTFIIPYTEKNGQYIIQLAQQIFRTRPGVFTQISSWPAKDPNDKLMGIHAEPPSPSRLLLDQPENRNQVFVTPKNYIIFHQQYLTLDHNLQEIVGEIKPFSPRDRVEPARNVVRYDFVLEALQQLSDTLDKIVPRVDDRFFRQAVTRGISFNEAAGIFERDGQVHARVRGTEVEHAVSIEGRDRKVVTWMTAVLQDNGNPNLPPLSLDHNLVRFYGQRIGEISPWFTFALDEGHSRFSEDPIGGEQLALFLAELAQVRSAWQLFREQYTDPLEYVHSSNLVLSERDVPLFKYDGKQERLVFLPEPADIAARSFHRFVYGALMIFGEDKVFYNNIRLIRVNEETQTLFYRRPDLEIGRLLQYEGKTYFALYPGIPTSIVRELQVFSPIPAAPPEIIAASGISLMPEGMAGRIKEKVISMVPYPYLRFFDERGKKFVTLPQEKVDRMRPDVKVLYKDAYAWHLKNNSDDKTVENTPSQRDRLVERNSTVWFNKIEVARYNPQTDRLDMLIPASGRFFQTLAIIERYLVKSMAQRQYSQYLTDGDVSKISRHIASSEIDAIHQRVSQGPRGEIMIVDKRFDLQTIGQIGEGKLVMDEAYLRFSESFREAMMNYASRLGLGLEWKQIEVSNDQPSALSTPVPVIETATTTSYTHVLRYHSAGLLQATLEAPVFKDKLLVEDGAVYIQFLTGEGETRFPLDHDWTKIKAERVWLSKQPATPKTLVLAQDPKQAVLYYQHYLPDSTHGNELFLSALNMGTTRLRGLVSSLVAKHTIKEIRVIGDRSFTTDQKASIGSALSVPMLALPLFATEQTTKKLERELARVEPDKALQTLLAGLPPLHIANPAEGVITFPMRSQTSPSSAFLGRQLFLSTDADALWYSQDLGRTNRVVLTPNVEEALYYIYLNQRYIRNDCVIAFQNTVTPEQVARLQRDVSVARFHRRDHQGTTSQIFVANTRKLSEQLLDRQFKVPFQIERPLREPTFREEYLTQIAGLDKVEAELLAVAHRRIAEPVGKQPAPMISMPVIGHEEQAGRMIHPLQR